jgi:hypothetical protein
MLVRDQRIIDDIVARCQVCRLALARDGEPYLVPVSFGYDRARIVFHTGQLGKKIDFMEGNPRTCFEFEDGVQIVPHPDDPCKTSVAYRSVIGYGAIQEINEPDAKSAALNLLMAQYGQGEHRYTAEALDPVRMWEIVIESMTAKIAEGA